MKKNDSLNMRIDPEQKRLLERAAALTGRSVSAYVLDHAVGAAKRELQEVHRYSLSLRDAQTFLKALEHPPAPNPSLKRAFSDFKKKYSKR